MGNYIEISEVRRCEDGRFTLDREYFAYSVKTKIEGQTVKVEFMANWDVCEQNYLWSVCLSTYNKRKHEERNHTEGRIVGHGLGGLMFAKQAVIDFEKFVVVRYPKSNHTMVVSWSSNRRRDVYARSLIRMGYRYGMLTIDGDSNKYLFKRL